MKQYLELLDELVTSGTVKDDRTGTGTASLFGRQLRFNLQEGFPLVTTKKVSFHNIVHELLWFLHGGTNTLYLNQNGVKIWDEWADEDGNLGPIYGEQWRKWRVGHYGEIDQISDVIEQIKNNPDSRRHVVTAWNPTFLPNEKYKPHENVAFGLMALAPCHCLFQFYVADGKLSLQMYQRSADIFLGVPYNIASYSLLLHMVAQQCDLEVGDYVHTFGDVHLYLNHVEQAQEQLTRKPHEHPQLIIKRKPESIFRYTADDFELEGYNPEPAIRAPIAV